MKLEGIIVCQNYSDFLEESLPLNISHFDRIVVVTHPEDKKTQKLCAKYGVDCVQTEVMHHGGDKFNKGRAINMGLAHLRHNGWLLHMDADIVLPHKFKQMLDHAHLNQKCIYGTDRQNTKSYENWVKHKDRFVPQHQWGFLTLPHPEFPMGARLIHYEHGYCPIGYFQLWHSSHKRRYPIISGSAEHSDVVFAVQWPLHERILLPEIIVTHLESEEAEMGANWQGRRTKPFGPRKPHHHPPKKYCK